MMFSNLKGLEGFTSRARIINQSNQPFITYCNRVEKKPPSLGDYFENEAGLPLSVRLKDC